MEDIDTIDAAGASRRFLQAKEIANPTRFLGLGDLADFLEHATPILRHDSGAIALLVTNGKFGGGIEATGWGRGLDPSTAVVQVIAAAVEGVEDDEVVRLLHRVRLVEEAADIGVLAHELAERRRIDPSVAQFALDRCLKIIVDTAADQASTSLDAPITLTHGHLDEAIEAAIRVVATAGLSADKLHRVVSPLTFRTRSDLTEQQFLRGVDVKPEHIAAGLDIPRTEHLRDIADGLHSDRLVLVVGPSGSGKSALLWRAASEHADRMRVWRVHDLGAADADTLVAAVEQQQPSDRFPMLVCVDDIGRPTRLGWRKAATAMLEISGVYVLGAAREEDFAADDALRRAVIVRPHLERRTAKQIERVLRERGITPVMAVDEALPRARGLLMEFLHLVVAGRRLANVLNEQASALEDPARHTELAVARYITSAHRVGLDVTASALETRFHSSDLSASLRRLEREHMLVESASGRWTGLHELRSTELSARLHDRPPPRLAETLSLVLADGSTTDGAPQLTTLVQTALDNELIAATLVARLRSADEEESATWLEATRLADIAEHARACVDAARHLQLPAATKLVQFLFLAHSSRFAGVDLSILPEEFHQHAARLPEPDDYLHQRAAAAVDVVQWIDRALHAEPAVCARLIEALEHGIAWTEDTATSLGAAVPSGDATIDARIIASAFRGCVDGTARSALIGALPSTNTRLQALRNVWPLLSEAKFDRQSKTVKTRFMQPIDGHESAEQQAANLAAVTLDLLPEATVAEVTVTRYDGTDLPLNGRLGPHKSIPRENLPPQVVTRWNRAFSDAVERELASDSLTLRLRQQASAVKLARDVVIGAVERVVLFDREDREKRRWITRVEQLERDVAALKEMPSGTPLALAPLGSAPRSRVDSAAQALETIASVMTQFINFSLQSEHGLRQQRMRLVGSRLRDAARDYREAINLGSPRLAGEPDPMDPVLLKILEDVASTLIAYADGLTLPPHVGRVTLDHIRAAVEVAQYDQQEAEHAILVRTLRPLSGVGLGAARLVRASDKPMPVPDPRRWLIPVPPQHLEAVAEAVLTRIKAATISHPLAFRVVFAPADNGALFSYPGLIIGSSNIFPVDVAEMRVLADDAEVAMLPGRFVEAVATCIESLVRASRAARAAQALADTAQALGLSERAGSELQEAQDIIATIDFDEVSLPLRAIAESVLEETDGTDTGALATEFDDALQHGRTGARLRTLNEATLAAALAD